MYHWELLNKYDIAICIPSKNENETISNIVSIIDEWLKLYYPTKKTLIVNIDSNSTDNTRQAFLKCHTESDKQSFICNNESYQWKGANLLQFLEYCSNQKIDVAATIDADLKSITPEWIKSILDPILNQSIDFVAPLYSRHKYDATITNQICLPIISLVYGSFIRQPIWWEFSFNGNFIRSLLWNLKDKKLIEYFPSENIHKFGIDILMTVHALNNNMITYQSFLGKKIHAYRSPSNLSMMFNNVVSTLFAQIKLKLNLENNEMLATDIPFDFPKIEACESSVDVNTIEIKLLSISEYCVLSKDEKMLATKLLGLNNIDQTKRFFNDSKITSDKWMQVIELSIELMLKGDIDSLNIAKILYPLFLLKVYSHFYDIQNVSDEEAELMIQKQAFLFYKNRKALIKNFKLL